MIAYAALSGVCHQAFALTAAGAAAWLVGISSAGAKAPQLQVGLALLAAVVLPLAILPCLSSFLAHVAAFRVLADLRARVYAAFERLAPSGLSERRSGELSAAAISDVELGTHAELAAHGGVYKRLMSAQWTEGIPGRIER